MVENVDSQGSEEAAEILDVDGSTLNSLMMIPSKPKLDLNIESRQRTVARRRKQESNTSS